MLFLKEKRFESILIIYQIKYLSRSKIFEIKSTEINKREKQIEKRHRISFELIFLHGRQSNFYKKREGTLSTQFSVKLAFKYQNKKVSERCADSKVPNVPKIYDCPNF
jgi:hypothetical protein